MGVDTTLVALTGSAGRRKLGVTLACTSMIMLTRWLGEQGCSSGPDSCSSCGGDDGRTIAVGSTAHNIRSTSCRGDAYGACNRGQWSF